MRFHRAATAWLLGSIICAVPLLAQAGEDRRSPAQLAEASVAALDGLFSGPNAGARAVHANGILCEGAFAASPDAAALSRAPHLAPGSSVPAVVRFSGFSGRPGTPESDPGNAPHGMAIKFALPDGGDTDIVAHSYDGFPVATVEDFVEFTTSLAAPDGGRLARFAEAHPAAKTFLEAEKPAPASYATESFFGVNAFRFSNAAGESRFGRYVLVPEAGSAHLDAATAAARPADYLSADLTRRLRAAPVRFRIFVQLADPTDQVDDGSRTWPADRPRVEIGTLSLTGLMQPQDGGRPLLFTPLNLVEGIAPSADPLLVARNRAYGVSYGRRARIVDAEPATGRAEPVR